LQGWVSSMIDMMLLSRADIVVAGMRSTFTQSLPLATATKFCQVSETGLDMSCFSNRLDWLLGKNEERVANSSVYHKITVHLPDMEQPLDRLRAFLDSNETFLSYGERFNKKYRQKTDYATEWTWGD
jgi:hypothetical protein